MSDDANVTSNNEIAQEVFQEAESQGWVPKERFRGNEADWVDADTFVKRGREILPILRKNNENLVKDLQSTKQQLQEFKQAAEEFKKFQKDAYERRLKNTKDVLKKLKKAVPKLLVMGMERKLML